MGPDALITVRGRKSGLPRTTPVAVAELSGRRFVISPWGEVDWARNLRAAGGATVTMRRHTEEVTAVELTPDEAVAFYRDLLAPFARATPIAAWIVRHVDGIDVDDPVGAARAAPCSSSTRVGRLPPLDRGPVVTHDRAREG